MKKILCVLAVVLLFSTIVFAKEKTFTKEATEVVPASQSQDQVIAYLTQKLTREATEEAGTFITSELNIKNYEITKDEFTSFAGAISKVKVENKETFTKNNQQYVKVKLNVTVDTDNVKTYLEKIMQDNEYKKEAEELRQKNLELEKQLKTATKQQYEKELSTQVQHQVELQKKQELEIEKLTLKAKEEFAKAKEEQDKKTAEREKEILELKNQIAQEQNNIKKAELENQARIKELENKAKNELKNYSAKTKTMTVQQAMDEIKKLKNKIAEITVNFETLIKNNRNNLIKSYDEQFKLSADTSSKGNWETTEQYNERIEKSKIIKQQLEEEKSENIFEYNKKTLNSMITTLEPFENKLDEVQQGSYFDKSRKKASIEEMSTINADEGYFYIKLKFKDKPYRVGFIFDKPEIGIEKAKLIYQTPKQFVIEPFYFIDKNLVPVLKGFFGKHLGTGIEKNWDFYKDKKISQFDEIQNMEYYKQLNRLLKKIEQINKEDVPKEKLIAIKSADILDKNIYANLYNECEKLGRLIVKVFADDKRVYGLRADGKVMFAGNSDIVRNNIEKWTDIVDMKIYGDDFFNNTIAGIRKDGKVNVFLYYQGSIAGYMHNEEWYNNLKKECESIEKEMKKIENEQNLVSVAVGAGHIVGLKKDGTVVAYGDNYYGQCNVKNWKNIKAIYANYGETVGIKEDGTVVVATSDKLIYSTLQNFRNWKNIVEIIPNSDGSITACLKKDGTVLVSGLRAPDKGDWISFSNVDNWTDIIQIAADHSTIIGLKKDGTVVAAGRNDHGQCNVSDWKDIVKIAAGELNIFGLKKDGTVVYCGKVPWYMSEQSWTNIIDISVSKSNIIGLKKDGTVVAADDDGILDTYNWGK